MLTIFPDVDGAEQDKKGCVMSIFVMSLCVMSLSAMSACVMSVRREPV